MKFGLRVAVIVPCCNEAETIACVVSDFKRNLPLANIVVLDNASTDLTAQAANEAGATVLHVGVRGKGNVVRRAFADVDADVYVLVDGDGTYAAKDAPTLIRRLVGKRLDMVVASREGQASDAYRPGHVLGNRFLTGCVAWLFGRTFDDLLSGYRVFSRRYAKSFPAHSTGFEIETELSVHALQLKMPVDELASPYGARPEGSHSKLRTYRDGFRIIGTILGLLKAERPFLFFGIASVAVVMGAMFLAFPLLVTYWQTGLVPRLPTALLCVALVLTAMVSMACGLILDTVTRGRIEAKHMAYLAIPQFGRNPGAMENSHGHKEED